MRSLHLAHPLNWVASVSSMLFVMVHAIDLLLPSFLLPPILVHHCLDGWSASTGCVANLLSACYEHPALSLPCTHHRFFQSFHSIFYIYHPSIYLRCANAATLTSLNSTQSSSCVVLSLPMSCVASAYVLQVKNCSIDYHPPSAPV